MYTYRTSTVLPYGKNTQYRRLDIRNITIGDLYTQYESVRVVVYDDVLLVEKNLSTNYLYSLVGTYSNSTITEILNIIDPVNIVTTTELWNNLHRVNYVNITDKILYRSDVLLPRNDRMFVSDINDLGLLDDYVVYVHNGLLLLNEVDTKTSIVKLPGVISNENKSFKANIGILDFSSLGTIKKYNIDNTNISISNTNTLIINIPDTIQNKTVILSICGYMIYLEQSILTLVSNNSVELNMDNINLPERISEANKILDPVLNTGIPPTNTSTPVELLTYYTELLNTPNSFIVVVDTPVINVIKHKVYVTPNNIIYDIESPKLPMISGYGYINSYRYSKTNINDYTIYLDLHSYGFLPVKDINNIDTINGTINENTLINNLQSYMLELRI